MVHALQHAQTALLVQPSSPRYLRSTHISYTDPSSIANPRRVYFPGARPKRLHEALDYATPQEVETEYYLTQPINTGP